MASVHRKDGTKFWHGKFSLPDGRRMLRSTKQTDKSLALRVAMGWEQAARMKASKDQALRVLADIVKATSGDRLSVVTLHEFADRWLERKSREVATETISKYSQVVKDLKERIPEHWAMDDVSISTLVEVRDAVADRTSIATANQTRKIIRGIWKSAYNDGHISENIGLKLTAINAKKERAEAVKRRPFTLAEVEKCLSQLDPPDEWYGMILCGVYSGQRLGDIARMKAEQIKDGIWRFKTKKTGMALQIGLAMPVRKWLETHAPKSGFVFPVAAGTGRTGTLSNRFYEIMTKADLVPKRRHRKQGDRAPGAKRKSVELGFHCFRHTTQTWLMEAGASRELAMAHVGHEDEQISEGYTHISVAALHPYVEKMPLISPRIG